MKHSWDLTEEQKKNIKPVVALESCREPILEEIINAYNKYVFDLGGYFLEFAEAYNQALQTVKKTGTIISTLKIRIKDFSSARSNSEKKELDDMFGMEIATTTELEKEEVILFNELLFGSIKSKEWKKTEKEGGYSAFHNTGYPEIKEFENLQDKIVETIENSQTEQWTTSSKKQKERKKVNIFRILKEEIKDEQKLSKITTTMERMLIKIAESNLDFDKIPMIESHILTLAKQREAIMGESAHYKYKKGIAEDKIKELYETGKLFRGINAPWKWDGREQGLALQRFDETIEQNWPFLSEIIQENRYSGNVGRMTGEEYDTYFAKIFPFLRKYVQGEIQRPPEEIKRFITKLTEEYRLDFTNDKGQEK